MDSKIIFNNKFYQIRSHPLKDKNKNPYIYDVIEMNEGVRVLPYIKDRDEIILINEYRFPINMYSLELPGGGISQNETPRQAAKRELQEETGILVEESNLQEIGNFYNLPAFSNSKEHIFLAEIDSTTTHNLDLNENTENIEKILRFSRDEVRTLISKGEILSSLTISALSLFLFNQK